MEAEPRNHPYFIAPSKSVCSAYDSIRTRADVSLRVARHRAKKLNGSDLAVPSHSHGNAIPGNTDPVVDSDAGQPNQKGTASRKSEYSQESRDALQYLNEKSGKNFRESTASLVPINARMSESGVDLAGVKKMIARQCGMWAGTRMQEYLRPETLFGKEKFDGYYASKDLPINLEDRKTASTNGKSDDQKKLFRSIINSI